MPSSLSKDKIAWECQNGGQLWTESAAYDNGASIPSGFCTSGFSSLNTAFIGSLLVDLGFQVNLRLSCASGLALMMLWSHITAVHDLSQLAILETVGALFAHEGTILRR